MITILESAGSPKDRATATVDSQAFEARSASGVIFALCRALVAAGVPDQPWQSINTAAPGIVSMRGPSIHRAAGLTVTQRDDAPPKIERWRPSPTAHMQLPMRAGLEGRPAQGAEPARVLERATAHPPEMAA